MLLARADKKACPLYVQVPTRAQLPERQSVSCQRDLLIVRGRSRQAEHPPDADRTLTPELQPEPPVNVNVV